MRGLDLYCGAGGASRGYYYADFEMVGVDSAPQKRYEYTFHQADAIATLQLLLAGGSIAGYTLEDFDFIHASPPCQAYSVMVKSLTAVNHPKLVKRTRKLLLATNKPYVIENVPGAPLIAPVQLCGTSFDIRVRRHRLFESNIKLIQPKCKHKEIVVIDPVGGNNKFKLEGDKRPIERAWREEMGVVWMTQLEARQAIPPVFTHFIGEQIKNALQRSR